MTKPSKKSRSQKKPKYRESEYRKHVAEQALRVRAGRLDYYSFLDIIEFGHKTSGDHDVDTLVNLLEHVPVSKDLRGMGLGTGMHNRNLEKIDELIKKLNSD